MKRAATFILLTLFLFCVGYAWRDIQALKLPGKEPFAKLLGIDEGVQQTPVQEFKQTYNRILTYYYKSVDPLELKYAGIGGLMASLGDPHTMFLVPKIAKRFDTDVKANYVGIGARLSPDTDGARAVTVFEDGPAFAAGLRRGDKIVTVQGISVAGMMIDKIVERIQGEEGTKVKLGVLKGGKGASQPITVTRAHVITPTVEGSYFRKEQIGYLSVANFAAPTAEQFDKELEKLERNPLKGLIIDVRSNPGGYLETAVEMLGRFKANKLVVKMKMRDGDESREYTASGNVHPFDYPIIVLINGDSASAAEIFAGALRDYKVATLLGDHSYGKASVQEVFQIRDGSSAKITIAKYFLPLTGDISRKVDDYGTYISGGLEPDIKVQYQELTPEEIRKAQANWNADQPDPSTDNQLRKAIEVLSKG